MAKPGAGTGKGRGIPFWRAKPLEALSRTEWEALCDGCGRCCLVKLEDADTGEFHFTNIGCRLLDAQRCRCTDYKHRIKRVSDCVKLDVTAVRTLDWLPPTCAYRLVAEGKDLYWWHPLVSGSPDTVHEAKVSIRGKVAALENEVAVERLADFIVSWPGKFPVGGKGRRGVPKVKTA
ncbi:MAG: YcgN family cysteine cluster protein [Methylobacteriaceae bacterium]|nr:YcgN family cysteine cluster protein [Methylobacteriaceae bacterium]